MRIIALSTPKAFWEGNPSYAGAVEPTLAWYRHTLRADWASPLEVKQDFRNASILKDGRVVFNIAGNKYRLLVWNNYAYRVVYIKRQYSWRVQSFLMPRLNTHSNMTWTAMTAFWSAQEVSHERGHSECTATGLTSLAAGWAPATFLSQLCERELEHRLQQRYKRYLKEARLPAGKTINTRQLESLNCWTRRPPALPGGYLLLQ